MSFIDRLKGVFKSMIAPKTIEEVLQLKPSISVEMQNKIEEWEQIYKDNAPWLKEGECSIKSLGLASMIASEKARTATIEMDIKITGEGGRAKYIRDTFNNKVLPNLRENLEYGIALGGFVIKPYVIRKGDKYDVSISFSNASDFFPLSFSADGDIVEAAFTDHIIKKDETYTRVEYQKFEDNSIIIRNYAFKGRTDAVSANSLGSPISLAEVPEWSAIDPEVKIENVEAPLFAYFKMPEANNIDLKCPLGVSGFSKAVGLIRDADEQYSNLLWEFEGGQLAIDVDRTALNLTTDAHGKDKVTLGKLQQRLYRNALDLGTDDTYKVFSPQLRDGSIINGLNTILTQIEDKVALSRGSLSTIVYAEARTATEMRILKQRCYSANYDIQTSLQRCLEKLFVCMDTLCDLYAIEEGGEYEVAYSWDDSILVDKDSERQVDLIDVDKGLMSKVEYRMKWFGETEDQAIQSLKKIQEEQSEMQENLQNNQTNDGNLANQEKPKDADPSGVQRAIESGEIPSSIK